VTSLPELVTGVSAITLANIPNIAVGSLLGSCGQPAILVVLDYLVRGESCTAIKPYSVRRIWRTDRV
jgi:cation:H+ antiporter